MSKDNFDAVQAEMAAIPDAETTVPNMPVAIYLQEASDLEQWYKNDQPNLIAAGVDQAIFDALPIRTGALRYAQSMWRKDRHSQEEARQQWDEQSPAAFELKDLLEHTFRFAFRRRADLLKKVQAIEDGSGNADLVQDLSDLSVLGTANLSLLTNIPTFDATTLETAATLADEMSELLARMNGERAETGVSKILRDKAYTLLKQTVDEIREAGKFVFWKDEKRLKGYYSARWTNR